MKAAISGVSGFLGSHLREALQKKGYQVLPITQELLYNPKELEAFFTKEQPEYIFHAAAYGNMSNQKDVAMTVFANLIGTFNMLTASLDVKYKKFINFSTSSVLLPTETYYSASKAGAERLANAFAQQAQKPILTVRPYSIYGGGEAEFRFIPTLIRCLLTGEHMQIDLAATHDWVYVGDFIKKLIHIMDKEKGVVNMGTGQSYSNLQIKEILCQIADKKLNYATVPKMRDFDTKEWVSPDKTIKSDIKDGLRRTYEWYYKQSAKA